MTYSREGGTSGEQIPLHHHEAFSNIVIDSS
jgi:hypothetical protein